MSKFKKNITIPLRTIVIAVLTQFSLQNMQVQAVEFNIPSSATVNLNTATLNSPGTVTVASSGTLQASTGTITVSNNGNWANSGTFTQGNSTVEFAGTSHSITGSATFYNLKCTVAGGQLTFEANKTQAVSSTLTLTGASGNLLRLRSSTDGTQWSVNPQGTWSVNFVDVKDSNNLSSTTISVVNWTDSGNNTRWSTAGGDGGGGGDSGGVGGGGVTLTVSSTSPSSGATGVAVNTTISSTFSDNMNGSTLTTNTFKVSGGGSTVSGSVSTSSNKATFTPSSNLAYNTKYTVTITTGAQAANAAGTSLSSDHSWSFTTVSAGVSTPTPTAVATVTPTQTTTATPTPTAIPSPSPTATPSVAVELSLSKYTAYLSGDTIVATVIDADRNTGATSEDTLTTAIKVENTSDLTKNLFLDLIENGLNSGTFLATIKTGTTTTGGASSSIRTNSGTIKATQGGTATVIYTDTTPTASTLTKTLALSSFDALLFFNNDAYPLNSYAGMTLADAERNVNHTEAESLLNDVFIETSSFNITRARMIETGADTGTFVGSIQVAAGGGTLELERIQAAAGDTLVIRYIDEINTTGSLRAVTDTASVATAVTPTPTPTVVPTLSPSPSASPTPSVCEATSIAVSPRKLTLKRKQSKEVSVTLTGENDCPVEGETVTATVRKGDKKRVSVTSSAVTDADGVATFTITGKKTTDDNAKITFKAGSLKKTITVKGRK